MLNGTQVTTKGRYYIPKKDLRLDIRGKNFPLAKEWRQFIESFFPTITIKQGILSAFLLKIHKTPGRWNGKGIGKIHNTSVLWKTYSRAGSSDIKFSFTIPSAKPSQKTYKVSLFINEGAIRKIPRLHSLEKIRGPLSVKNGTWQTNSLSAVHPSLGPIKFKGILHLTKPSSLKLTARLTPLLENLAKLFPEITEKTGLNFSGKSDIQFHYKGKLPSSSPLENITIKIQPSQATLTFNPLHITAKDISGLFVISGNTLSWEKISAYWDGNIVNTSGNLKNFADPHLAFEATSSLHLKSLLNPFLEKFFPDQKIQLNGAAKIFLTFNGSVKRWPEGKIRGSLEMTDGGFYTKKLPLPIRNLSGTIHVKDKNIFWENLKGEYNNLAFLSKGKAILGKPLRITTTLKGPNIQLTTSFSYDKVSLKIQKASGHFYHSLFDFKGIVENLPQTPYLRISGSSDMDLQDLSLYKKWRPFLEKLKPSGKISISGSLEGPLHSWAKWNIHLTAKSPQLILQGYHFDNIAGLLQQEEGKLSLENIRANLYGGKLTAQFLTDLTLEGNPSAGHILLEDVDLQLFKNDTVWKDKDIRGKLMLQVSLEGPLENTSAITGKGNISIKEGKLWEMDLLKGLGKFLFIPEFRNIVFHEAQGNFIIKDKRLYTTNFTLNSEPVTLLCRGWIDISGELRFGIFSKFSRKAISQSNSLKKIITTAITSSDNYLTIKLTGTLQKPHYYVVPSSVDLFQRTTEKLFENIQNIFN